MATQPARRRARAQPLSDFIEACLGPALAKQGFTGADILASWPEIVGDRLGAASQPIRVQWARKFPGREDAPTDPATLVVRVESAFALELQHLAPLILERVNGFYGWRCVGKLVLKQGPVRRRQAAAPPPRPLTAAEARQLSTGIGAVADAPLRDALDRLGHAVMGATREPGGTGGAPVAQSPQD